MSYSITAPTNSRYLQGGQILRMDSRIEVSDRLQNTIHKFPISDYGAIADNGEFYFMVDLDTSVTPWYLFDESLVGFTGDSPAADIDLLVMVATDPVVPVLGYGVEDYTPTVLPPISDPFIWKGNAPYDVSLEEDFYRRVLPMKIYLPPGISNSRVELYMVKFSPL